MALSSEAPGAVDYDAGWRRWDDMVRHSPAPWHRRRIVVETARPIAFRTVLDVGCGPGEMLAALRDAFPDRAYTGMDLSEEVVAINAARFPEIEFRRGDIEDAGLGRRFDLVVCSEVLEHCADPARALANLRELTAGHLILTVPSGPVFPLDRSFGHHRHFEPRALAADVQAAGFEVIWVRRWGFPFHTLYKLAINLRPEASLAGFARGRYGPAQKAVSRVARALFHASVPGAGWQLFALARPR